MDCNEEIHILLKNIWDIYCLSCNNRINCDDRYHIELNDTICPFCDDDENKNIEHDDKLETCCNNKEIVDDSGQITCRNCGMVDHYTLKPGFIDFYEICINLGGSWYITANIILKTCSMS